MTNAEFERVLRRAIGGSEEDLELIFKLYEPLIYKYSCIKGEYDEDMHQQLRDLFELLFHTSSLQ